MIGKKIDHIGIAVSNLDEAIKMYASVFGFKPEEIHRESLPPMNIAMIPIGESKIELIQTDDPQHTIARFIANRGEGMHHLAVGVQDINGQLEKLQKKGVPLVDREARIGAGGHKAAFIHPKATRILLELVEVEHRPR